MLIILLIEHLVLNQNIIGKNNFLINEEKYMKYFNSTLVAEYIINKTFNKKIDNKKFIWTNK